VRQSCVRQAVKEVRWLIEHANVRGSLRRPRSTGSGSFYGPHEYEEFVVAADIPVELKILPARLPSEIGADATANVLPDCAVQEQDILVVGPDRYRVTDLQRHDYFGSITHIGLTLAFERLHHG